MTAYAAGGCSHESIGKIKPLFTQSHPPAGAHPLPPGARWCPRLGAVRPPHAARLAQTLPRQQSPPSSSPPRAAPAAPAARHPTPARRASRRRPAACADCARLARLGEPPVAPAGVPGEKWLYISYTHWGPYRCRGELSLPWGWFPRDMSRPRGIERVGGGVGRRGRWRGARRGSRGSAAGVRAPQGRWNSLSVQASASCASYGNVHVQAVLERVRCHREAKTRGAHPRDGLGSASTHSSSSVIAVLAQMGHHLFGEQFH